MGVWADEDPTARECMDSEENWKGRYWGVLCSEWNGTAHARGYSIWDRGNRTIRNTGGQVWKETDTGRGIRLTSLNIRMGRAGGLDTALRALYQGNVDMGLLQETKLTQGRHTGMARNTMSGQQMWGVGIGGE